MTAQLADRRIRTQPDEYFRPDTELTWMARAQAVESRRDLSDREFVREYVRRQRPVVIKDGVPKDAVTPETLRSCCGHRPLANLVGGSGSPILVRGSAAAIEKFRSLGTLGEYLTHFAEADLPYLTNLSISRTFPEAAEAFVPPCYFGRNWVTRWPFSAMSFGDRGGAELFISSAGGTYGVLHYDRPALFLGICQYFGKKLWWLCPPEQSEYLYTVGGRHHNVSRVNPFSPDLQTYPLFEQVKPFVVTLEAGDLMFVPSSWWHMTKAITPNIAALHRILNRHNIVPYLGYLRRELTHNRGLAVPTLKQLIWRK